MATAKVKVSSTEVVVPAEETPAGPIWLSNLNQVAVHYSTTVYFYRSNGEPGFFAADGMKDSLARALVVFYPFAGRLGLDGAGRVQVECTGEGAVFLTASSDHTLNDLITDESMPCKQMRDLFVPPAPAPTPPCGELLLAQVTYLSCGGVVLGLAMHHAVTDARGAAHFLQTWASIARASGVSGAFTVVDGLELAPPCFDQTPLAARAAGARAVLYDHMEYRPVLKMSITSRYTSAFLTLSREQVGALRARCAGASTFRAVVALVWRCACRARALPPEAVTRLYSMVDVRARLVPPLPRGYFGSAVVRTSTAATAGEVVSSPVGHAARLARTATSQGDDYARSLVDYLESLETINLPVSGIMTPSDLWAVSWMGMSLGDADFGWGSPAFMGPGLIPGSGLLYVMNTPGNDGGGVMLVMSLEPESMPEFKKLFAEELAHLELEV